MQTILGAGGVIAIELAKNLTDYTKEIRLCSRNPKKVNITDELFPCDLINPDKVMEAVKGSEVTYLTVGFPYETKVWQSTWPVVMRNTIDACKKHGSKLVFFDNVYLYDPEQIEHMTEETMVGPASKKGKVRAEIVKMLEREMANHTLKATIARAADFYGPGNDKSFLMMSVFDNIKKGKKANWLGSVKFKHSFTFTPDAGKATAMLGNSEDAYGETWHLPTAKNPPTGDEWIAAIAKEMKAEPKSQVAGKVLLRIMGLFIPIMGELVEMLYQYDRDYVFDSSKFENQFGMKPTPYDEGIRISLEQAYSN